MPPIKSAAYIGFGRYLKMVWDWLAVVLRDLFLRTETRSAEITFGMIGVGWCVVLLASPDAFTVGNLYDYLSQVFGQTEWAMLMGLLGGAQLVVGAALKQRAYIFVRAAVWAISALVWSYIAMVSLIAVPVTTAAAAYSVIASGSAWAFIRSIEER